MNRNSERNSSIELLKIIAMLLIIINHVSMTAEGIDLSTTSVSIFVRIIFRHFGAIGNAIFVICSSWFLVDNPSVRLNKIVRLFCETWMFSVLILVVCRLSGLNISGKIIIKSFFPIVFKNNWFITAYIMLYAVHGLLNIIINSINQRTLLILCTTLFFMYYIASAMYNSAYFYSHFMLFLSLYFITAYVKKYLAKISLNSVINQRVLIAGSIGLITLLLVTNIAGLYIGFFNDKTLYWAKNANPFVFLISFAMFNLFRSRKYVNRTINHLSAVSLVVYLLHENIIISESVRPLIWESMITKWPHVNSVLLVLLFAIIITFVSYLVALIYDITGRHIVLKLSDTISERLDIVFTKALNLIMSVS